MKKIFTFATLMIVLSAVISHANATIRRVAPAGYFSSPIATIDFTDLQSAHDAAVAGDTIQVYPGANWQAYYSKQLVTMGYGYYVDEATYGIGANKGLQNITGYVNTGVYLSAGSDNCVFEGLDGFHLHGDGSGATITGIIVRRCLGQVDLSAHNVFTNWQISQCYLSHLTLNHDAAAQAVINNLTISNSRIGGVGGLDGTSGNNNGQFTNCIFEGDSYFNNGSYLLKNNIFLAYSTQDANCVYQYNLYINDSRTIPGVGNRGISSEDMATKVFKGYSIQDNNSNDARFLLKSGSPAKDINDTTDAGMYGGPTPYKLSGIPAVPAFYKFISDNSSVSANPFTLTFSVRSNNDAQAPISKVEYYINADPGYGNGTPVAIQNITELEDIKLSINISGLSAGTHAVFIRSLDANGGWSLDNKYNFTVTTPAVAPPSVTLNSVSKTTLCAGEAFLVGINAKGNFRADNVFTVELSNPTGGWGSPITIASPPGRVSTVVECTLPTNLASGTRYKVRVKSSSPIKTSPPNADDLTINALPTKPTITASGSVTNLCPGTDVTLTASAQTGATYQWYKNGTAMGGKTNPNLKVTAAGTYTVTRFTVCGSSTSDPKQVTYLSCVRPSSLIKSGITASSANLSWTGVNCGTNYQVQYKESTSSTWLTAGTTNVTNYTLTGLNANTTYNWQVKTVCSANSSSGYRVGPVFTTLAALTASTTSRNGMKAEETTLHASISPNPASTIAVLTIDGRYKPTTVTLSDITGKAIWKAAKVTASRIDLPVANLSTGVYIISVTDGIETKVLKLVKGQQ